MLPVFPQTNTTEESILILPAFGSSRQANETTKTFLFTSDGPDALGALAVASRHSPKTLEDALLF